MTRPQVTPSTEEAYAALLHLVRGDEATDWTTLRFLDALLRQLWEIEQLSRDSEDFPGWARIMDIDAAPVDSIWWLGQFIGVTPTGGLNEAGKRIRVREADGWKRGAVGAIRGAARQFLSGTRTVNVFERDASPYNFRIQTLDAETADQDQIERAIRSLTPAGLTFVFEVLAVWKGQYGWEETITISPFACPLPHVELLPSEELLPC